MMSQEIRLNERDYKQILTWFELAFAREGKVQTQDDLTIKKIAAMAQAQQEERGRDLHNEK